MSIRFGFSGRRKKIFIIVGSLGVSYGVAIGAIALLTASIALPRLLNKYYTPVQTAASTLAQVGQIPEQERASVTLGWERPGSQKFAQFLYSARAATNVALACLSTTYQVYFVIFLFAKACS